MSWRQAFIVGGRVLGWADRSRIFVHGELQAPTGVAFFCPECVALWAVCPIQGEPTYPLVRPCERHSRTFYDHGGSLWLNWDQSFNSALPPPAISREFDLAVSAYSRYHAQFQPDSRPKDPPDGRLGVR